MSCLAIEMTRRLKNKFAAIEFCKAHNMDVKYMSDKDYEITKNLNLMIEANQQIAYDMHIMLPTLNFAEIDAISTATTVLKMFEADTPIDFIRLYLNYCTDFDENTINIITPKWCRGFILHLTNIDKERRK